MTRRIATLALALVIAAGLAGCAKKIAVDISSTVPATQAELKTSQDDNDNPVVELKVKHLAPPQNLQPARSTYVVWVETVDGKTYNAGRLKLNDDLEGGIKVMTPYPRFRLVVSAEDDPLAARPGSQRVIETEQIEID
jgi:hypothetical protein